MMNNIQFPEPTGKRCLMLPYLQGDPSSVPIEYREGYEDILRDTYIKKGDIGYLTIDEGLTTVGKPHRGASSSYERAVHTEAGRRGDHWVWGMRDNVTLEEDTKVLLANSVDDSCAVWDRTVHNTSENGDLGHVAEEYPLEQATLMKKGDVHTIGILTPHESLPTVKEGIRQFLRIISNTIEGRESHFTLNPLLGD